MDRKKEIGLLEGALNSYPFQLSNRDVVFGSFSSEFLVLIVMLAMICIVIK